MKNISRAVLGACSFFKKPILDKTDFQQKSAKKALLLIRNFFRYVLNETKKREAVLKNRPSRSFGRAGQSLDSFLLD
jgi:site-specific recombinase XerD